MTPEQLHQHVLAQTSQASHQKQYTFPTVLLAPQFHPAGVPTGGVPDPQQPTPDRGRPPNNVQLGQPHYAGEPATSPSTNSGRSNKRGADPSPVDGQVKRAKTSNKRPSKWWHVPKLCFIDTCVAPEDHQRQAMEIASRVSGIHSPSSAMLGHIPQPNSGVSASGSPRRVLMELCRVVVLPPYPIPIGGTLSKRLNTHIRRCLLPLPAPSPCLLLLDSPRPHSTTCTILQVPPSTCRPILGSTV